MVLFIVSIILTFTALLVSIVYCYYTWKYSYWKRLGVTYLEPHFFYGNAKDLVRRKVPLGNVIKNNYSQLKAKGVKHGGIYMFTSPAWYPIDIELIKTIMTRDFAYFMNHDASQDYEYIDKHEPLLLNLFNSTDERWKKLRVKLTPTFTSGKLKMMFQTLLDITPQLLEILNSHSALQDPVDIKDVVSRFTTDVIGSCAFGLDCNSLKNSNSEFRQYGTRLLEPRHLGLKILILSFLPKIISGKLVPKKFDADVENFFKQIVHDTVAYREQNNVFRKDFMHLLIQLKNRKNLTDDDMKNSSTEEGSKQEEPLTMNEVLANCVIFFLGGFETSATTMTFALLEMALNQDIQEKLRKEIHYVLGKHDGMITYDSIMEMKYLDMIIDETLRKHPPLTITPRICNKDYTVPDTNIVIRKGVSVHIPIIAVHHDPEFYPDPEKFDPERFTEENKRTRPPYTFLAFGEGPRICIGARFGRMQTRVGLVSIIKNFKVTLNGKTKTPIKYEIKSNFSAVEGGVWLNVNKIE